MAHLLKTMNPEAVAEIERAARIANNGSMEVEFIGDSIPIGPVQISGKPEPRKGRIPGIGEIVIYHPRPGEWRARREAFPAIVMASDPETAKLELYVIYGIEDYVMADGIVPLVDVGPAWSLVPERKAGDNLIVMVEGNAKKLEAFQNDLAELIFGESIRPEYSIIGKLGELDAKVAAFSDIIDDLKSKLNDVAPDMTPAKKRGRPRKIQAEA